jgi:thioredoxin
MADNVTVLNEKNFEEFIVKGNSVVDFWASWCGPCKMMAPEFEKAAGEMNGKVKFGKLSVENSQELAERFQVMSIPTLIFFKDGKPVERNSGTMSSGEIVKKAEESFKS